MNEWFVFAASCVCLLVGLLLCFLPARRYLIPANIGAAGGLFLVCGVVLMTTFKWTEVAIKISGLEFQLAKAEEEASKAQLALASVRSAVSPESRQRALGAVLASYRSVSNSDPTPTQLTDFRRALDNANVTVVPVQALGAINGPPLQMQNGD